MCVLLLLNRSVGWVSVWLCTPLLPEDSSHSFTSSVSQQRAELTHLKTQFVCVYLGQSFSLSLLLSLSCICTNTQSYLKISPFLLMWSCLFVCGSCSEWSPSGSHTWLWLACCDSSSPHHTLWLPTTPCPPVEQRHCGGNSDFKTSSVFQPLCSTLYTHTLISHPLYCTAHFLWKMYGV